MASVWGELKRRNVVKVAVAYAIVGWLLIEVSTTVLPVFEAPAWIVQVFTFFVILGFPLALILSWAYELTPDGMERTKSVSASESITSVTGQKLNYVIIGVLVLAVGFMFVDNYLPESVPFAGAEIDPASLDSSLSEASATSEEAEEEREALPNSVAVLPLANLSPDPDNDYFAAGIHDTILNELAKLQNVNVIARTSVLQYGDGLTPISEIAKALNVETVMEGSVQYAEGRILVTAQLIDPSTSAHLWSDNYDREFADIFAIQSDIAMNIANALEAEFSLLEQESIEKIPTASPEAYAWYLRALARTGDSVADVSRALEIDPDFALAYALRANFHAGDVTFSVDVDTAEAERLALEDAERALALDPSLGLAHIAMANVHEVYWRWVDARDAFEMAYELSPNSAYVLATYGRFKRNIGDYPEAIRVGARAVELDPLNGYSNNQLAVTYRFARDNEAAAQIYTRNVARDLVSAIPYTSLGLVEATRGNSEEAVRNLRRAEELFGDNITQVFRYAHLAVGYSMAGEREDAERLVRALAARAQESPVGEAVWALAYIALRDYDETLRRVGSGHGSTVVCQLRDADRNQGEPVGRSRAGRATFQGSTRRSLVRVKPCPPLFTELRRRNVVKVAMAYAIVGWLLIEVTTTVLPTFEAPGWVLQTITFVIILGFPLALVLSWAFDLTPQGVERTESVPVAGRKLDFAIIGLLVLAVVVMFVDNYLPESGPFAGAEIDPASLEPIPNDAPPTVREDVIEPRDVLPNSVAVLLCDNLSPDPDDAYFAASIHEEILNQLVKIRNLTPIARTSVLQYADNPPPISQIAEELRVESVLECSVRYAGNAIMVTAQLIDPETDLHLWSETYPGDLSDVTAVFEMQADIAMNIANALQVAFSVAEQESIELQPTESSAAYGLYLRAIATLQADRETALSFLEQAIVLDPDFALAHGRMAVYYAGGLVQTFGNPAADPGERANLDAEARRAAEQALRVDPDLGAAHTALAFIDQLYWRWVEAEQAYERARKVRPNDPVILYSLARLKSFQGNHDEAIQLMQRVVELNPAGGTYYVLASVLAHSGDPEAALAPARHAVEIDPANPVTHLWLARIGSALGNIAEVAEQLETAERLLIDRAAPIGLASLAYTYSLIGYDEDATRVLEELDAATPDREFNAGSWVLGYLAQGNDDDAFDSLQTVVNRIKNNEPDAAYYGLMLIKSNAQRHPVLDEPRFRDLRSQIGTSN